MALMTVKAGNKTYVIDCANKGTAKAFGRSKLEVEVSEATAADVTAFLAEGNSIEKVEPQPAKAAEVAEAAAE